MIYLDANANLPINKNSFTAIKKYMRKIPGNPSSTHKNGRIANMMLEKSKEKIASFIGCLPSEIILTSGGTEANNMALKGFPGKDIILSAIEHPSVYRAAPKNANTVSVKNDGTINLKDLKEQLNNLKQPLVSIMFANNETGVIQPIKKIVNYVHNVNGIIHCDAVQGLGKSTELNFEKLNLDMMTISAHKIGGPTGIGALIIKNGINCLPLIEGGGQQKGYRSGTENILGTIGFAATLCNNLTSSWENTKILRDHMERVLSYEGAEIQGNHIKRLSNTSCLRMPGIYSYSQVIAFDLKGIYVSAGSACSSGKISNSLVLKAMGINTEDTIRISLNPKTTKKDIENFIKTWKEIYQSSLFLKKETS